MDSQVGVFFLGHVFHGKLLEPLLLLVATVVAVVMTVAASEVIVLVVAQDPFSLTVRLEARHGHGRAMAQGGRRFSGRRFNPTANRPSRADDDDDGDADDDVTHFQD